MAKFKNHVELTGYVVSRDKEQNPIPLEVKTLQSGSEVCNMRLSTPEYKKTEDGSYELKHTEYHNVSVWSQDALDVIRSNKIGDGDLVDLTGKIQTRKQVGENGERDRYFTEVAVRSFHTFELVEKAKLGNKGKTKNQPYQTKGPRTYSGNKPIDFDALDEDSF